MKYIVVITSEEITKVENNTLNTPQLNLLLQKTPQNHVYKRPAKGGGEWKFVTGTYVKKVLNMMFGWDWDFVVDKFDVNMEAKQIIVLGKLVVRTGGKEITKMQFGRKDIAFRKDGTTILDLGNDMKSATTDALKKCASELGIASDIYAPNEFKEVSIVDAVEIPTMSTLIKAMKDYNGADKELIRIMIDNKVDAGEADEKFIKTTLEQLSCS